MPIESVPQTKTPEVEPVTDVEINDENSLELAALVDEALDEIEAGETRPWP